MPTKISVLAELERIGWAHKYTGSYEIKVRCPFHEDEAPSCALNTERLVFKCHTAGCGKQGDFITFLAAALHTSRAVVIKDLSTRYDLGSDKALDPDTIERYHQGIWDATPLLKALHNRGVTDELIRQYRLGVNDARVTIPITNINGLYVNVRQYLPGAPNKDKMRNLVGRGSIRLYPIPDQLAYDGIMVCGGEMKAIVAAAELNKHGIGAVTATGGEGNWEPTFSELLRGKRIWVCLDVDPEGQAAAQIRCAQLSRFANWVGNLILPLDIDKYPHGDINNWIGQEHKALYPLLEDVEQWVPPPLAKIEYEDPDDVELEEAIQAESVGKRLRIKAVVSAIDTAPYLVPKSIKVICDKSQNECAACPIFAHELEQYELHPESQVLLEMISSGRVVQHDAIMRGLSIPPSCKVVTFEPVEYYNIEDTRISPQLEITNRAAERVMQPAACIGTQLELNESYYMTGRVFPHPKTQQSTLLISQHKTAQDALSTYEPRNLEDLDVFKAGEDVESIASKLDELYEDLEANVTRIYKRRDMHIAVDLTYHSPLLIRFDDRTVKGWVETLVVGDSAQGKSETALNLKDHYGLGEKVECKNASVAGLLGGLQQMGSRWFVTWGVIPMHDKRLVILEELKGTNPEVIAKLTDMRSSGVAEIPKIEKRRTHARTRLIALSNPRSDQQLQTYAFGVQAIKELIGGLEDIRRFDLAIVLSANDITAADLNVLQQSRPTIRQVFTGDLCRRLILWAWTRNTDQVVITPDAQRHILAASTQLCDEFTDAIPLVDRGSMRLKLARLSAALAARIFSHDPNDRNVLLIKACHVDYVTAYIRRVYGSDTFGYRAFTEALNLTNTLVNPKEVKDKLQEVPFPSDLCKQMLHTDKIDVQDLCDWTGWLRFDAGKLLSFLVRKHALVRHGRSYRKTPPFIALINEVLATGQLVDRPDFIPDVEF